MVAITLGVVPVLISDYFFQEDSFQQELENTPEDSAHLVADLILASLERK